MSNEDAADGALAYLNKSINAANNMLRKNHEFYEYVLIFVNAFRMFIPSSLETKHVSMLIATIAEGIADIQFFIEENELFEASFIKEEEVHVALLEDNIAHKDWRMVLSVVTDNVVSEKDHVRLEKKFLSQLHEKFSNLLKEMNRDNFIKALKEDILDPKVKADFENKDEYYFSEMYKFVNFYEYLFKHFLKKEKKILMHMNRFKKSFESTFLWLMLYNLLDVLSILLFRRIFRLLLLLGSMDYRARIMLCLLEL